MPRARLLKPEFFTSPSVARLSFEATYLFAGLWCYADDYGVYLYTPRRVLGDLYIYRRKTTEAQICNWIAELLNEGLVIHYQASNGAEYIIIRNWSEHQHVAHPSRRRYLNDAIIAEAKAANAPIEKAVGEKDDAVSATTPHKRKKQEPVIPPDRIMEIWNQHRSDPGPKWRVVSSEQREAIAKLTAEYPDESDWIEAVKAIDASRFCNGANDRHWVAGPKYLLRLNDPVIARAKNHESPFHPSERRGQEGYFEVPENLR